MTEVYDDVTRPAHYSGDAEVDCKRAMRAMLDRPVDLPNSAFYWWACAFKYLWRWPFKGNPKKDLDKCVECLTELERTLGL